MAGRLAAHHCGRCECLGSRTGAEPCSAATDGQVYTILVCQPMGLFWPDRVMACPLAEAVIFGYNMPRGFLNCTALAPNGSHPRCLRTGLGV
jgi:hypothetical protein